MRLCHAHAHAHEPSERVKLLASRVRAWAMSEGADCGTSCDGQWPDKDAHFIVPANQDVLCARRNAVRSILYTQLSDAQRCACSVCGVVAPQLENKDKSLRRCALCVDVDRSDAHDGGLELRTGPGRCNARTASFLEKRPTLDVRCSNVHSRCSNPPLSLTLCGIWGYGSLVPLPVRATGELGTRASETRRAACGMGQPSTRGTMHSSECWGSPAVLVVPMHDGRRHTLRVGHHIALAGK